MTFLRDVETLFKEELNLDQFRVYSGNTATGIGFEINAKNSSEFTQEEKEQYNVLASKYVTDKSWLAMQQASMDSIMMSLPSTRLIKM
jgi:hypothetical protein